MEPSTTDLTFQGEDPNETVVFVLRRHPWTLIHTGLIVLFLLLMITAIFLYFQGSWVTSWGIFILLPIALYLGLRAWFIWANSMYVLTSERVIAVDQTGWFNRTVRELSLDNIMTISHGIQGATATLMNFGDVYIQASGASESDLSLTKIYDPYEVQQRIVRAKKGQREHDSH